MAKVAVVSGGTRGKDGQISNSSTTMTRDGLTDVFNGYHMGQTDRECRGEMAI